MEVIIIAAQRRLLPRAQIRCRKQTKLRNAIQNMDSISKFDNTDKPMMNNKLSNTLDFILTGPGCHSDKKKRDEITQHSK